MGDYWVRIWTTDIEYEGNFIVKALIGVIQLILFSILLGIGLSLLIVRFFGYLRKRFPLFFNITAVAFIIEAVLFAISWVIGDSLPITIFMLGIASKALDLSDWIMEFSTTIFGENHYIINTYFMMVFGTSIVIAAMFVLSLLAPCAYGIVGNLLYYGFCYVTNMEYKFGSTLDEDYGHGKESNGSERLKSDDVKSTNDLEKYFRKVENSKNITKKFQQELSPILVKRPNTQVQTALHNVETACNNLEEAYWNFEENIGKYYAEEQIRSEISKLKMKATKFDNAYSSLREAIQKAYA